MANVDDDKALDGADELVFNDQETRPSSSEYTHINEQLGICADLRSGEADQCEMEKESSEAVNTPFSAFDTPSLLNKTDEECNRPEENEEISEVEPKETNDVDDEEMKKEKKGSQKFKKGKIKERQDKSSELMSRWKSSDKMCSYCYIIFSSAYSYEMHMYQHHNKPGQTHVFKCEVCNYGFEHGMHFERHVKRYHLDDSDYLENAKLLLQALYEGALECESCEYRAQRVDGLHRHIHFKHSALTPHKCKTCDRRFAEESDCRLHEYTKHDGPVPYVCPTCQLTVTNAESILEHFRKAHKYSGIPNGYCFKHNRRFTKLTDSLNCGKSCLEDEVHHCDTCYEAFFSSAELKFHIDNTHEGKHKCPICGAMVLFLAGHMPKHSDKFKCQICDKGFETIEHLKRHKVVHTGEKPFQCELCGLRVSQRSALQRHQKVVHPDGKVKESVGWRPKSRRGRMIDPQINIWTNYAENYPNPNNERKRVHNDSNGADESDSNSAKKVGVPSDVEKGVEVNY